MAKSLKDLLTEARSRLTEIDPESAEELRNEQGDVLLLDVREAEEHTAGRIPDAVNIPRGLLEGAADPAYKRPHPELSSAHDRTVLVICTTGGRSALATVTLTEMGFTDVRNVAGGLDTWIAEDLPFEGELVEQD